MVRELLTYISHHLDGELTLEKLAAVTGYSPFYIHRKFKKETGEALGQFLVRHRIETAAGLLSLTRLPVHEIKHHVGYQTDSSFSKAFAKVMKKSPTAFRKSNPYQRGLSGVDAGEYLSLNHEIRTLPERDAIVFPSMGNYFTPEIYHVWGEVAAYLEVNKLKVSDFSYCSILHSCQNVAPDVPGRYDAVIVPREGLHLPSDKFFKSKIPSGRFVRYKFCAAPHQFQKLSLVIGKHMEENGIEHGPGVSYFKFDALPDADGTPFIEWYMPLL